MLRHDLRRPSNGMGAMTLQECFNAADHTVRVQQLAIEKKDAEIAQLKEQLEAQNIRVAALRENREEDNQFITELADTLERHIKNLGLTDYDTTGIDVYELLQRARETTKL